MDKPPSVVLVFIGLISLLVLSCIETASDTESGPAVIQGRLDEISSDQGDEAVANVSVSATEVTSRGDLVIIGENEKMTDENGLFSLSIEEDAWEEVTTDSRIVLQARKNDFLTKTFVTSEIISGIMVQAKPITVESTAEAEILQVIVAANAEGDIQNADIELAIPPTVGSGLQSDSQSVEMIAEILILQDDVKSFFYERQGVDPDYGEIYRLKNEAQVELENRLYDLSGLPEDRQAVFELFIRTMASIETDAGINPFLAAVASVLSLQVARNESTGLSDEVRSELYRVNSYLAASDIDRSVQNQLVLADFGNAIASTAEEAGQTLISDMLDTTETSIEEIRAMFESYREQVINAITNSGTDHSETFININERLRNENGAQEVFEFALESAEDPEEYAETYNRFSLEVRSDVNSDFNNLEADTSEAYANLMILLNIAS